MHVIHSFQQIFIESPRARHRARHRGFSHEQTKSQLPVTEERRPVPGHMRRSRAWERDAAVMTEKEAGKAARGSERDAVTLQRRARRPRPAGDTGSQTF